MSFEEFRGRIAQVAYARHGSPTAPEWAAQLDCRCP
jgi:hypothetical protein